MGFTAAAFEEACPGDNLFVGVGVAPESVQLPGAARFETVAGTGAGAERLAAFVAQSRIAIFHNVTFEVAGALAAAPSSVLRVWSGWGGDYYGTAIDSDAGLLGPRTRALRATPMRRPTSWAGRALYAARFGPVFRAAARAADVFSAPIPEDLQVFQNRFPSFRGQYSQLNYASVEQSIATGERRAVGRDILVGNSAAPINNHIETFEALAKHDLGDRRVIVPLSYGTPGYAAAVIRGGQTLLGDRFVALTDFMPLEAYNELLGECGIVVIGSQRQSAMGNILRALWQGAHIVLDRRNPVVEYLQQRGVSPLLLDEVARQGLPTAPVSPAHDAANLAFLDENWSQRVVVRNIRKLVDLA